MSLMLLVGIVGFVTAEPITMTKISDRDYQVSIPVYQGWNLLSGFATPDFITGGDITAINIKAIYAFDSKTKKYARTYPRAEIKWDDGELLTRAFWVYVDKSGTIEYKYRNDDIFDRNILHIGWNFVAITPEFYGKKLDDIKGNCNMERAYFWDVAPANQWVDFYQDPDFESSMGGTGLVIKASGECKLSTGSIIETPPAIPNLP